MHARDLFTYHKNVERDEYQAVRVIQRVRVVVVNRLVEDQPSLSWEAAVNRKCHVQLTSNCAYVDVTGMMIYPTSSSAVLARAFGVSYTWFEPRVLNSYVPFAGPPVRVAILPSPVGIRMTSGKKQKIRTYRFDSLSRRVHTE